MLQISVIIPIYNVEKYIVRCVHSLMKQTMKEDIEFIFVNDCTPDSSMKLLHSTLLHYPERTSQILIINNERNLGIAETRKVGVRNASGLYLGWCDPDDWVELNMFEKMWECSSLGKKDIVVCDCFEENNETTVTSFIPAGTPHDVLANSWRHRYMPYGLVFQLFRRSLILDSIEYLVPTNQGEDTYLMRYAYFYARSISFVSKPLYHYNRINLESITHNPQLTQEQWIAHQQNIEKIDKLLCGDEYGRKKFRISVSFLKFNRKHQYRRCFKSMYDYYVKYSECYRYVNSFSTILPNVDESFQFNKSYIQYKLYRLKTYLVYNFYPLFWLYFHEEWKRI